MYDDWMEDVPIFVDKIQAERNLYERINKLEERIKFLEYVWVEQTKKQN